MKKHKIPVHVRALADRYYCEQCDRLGVPRPRPKVVVDPAKLARDNADGLAIEAMLMGKAPRMGLEAILKAYSDQE